MASAAKIQNSTVDNDFQCFWDQSFDTTFFSFHGFFVSLSYLMYVLMCKNKSVSLLTYLLRFVFVRALPCPERQLWGHVVSGEGAASQVWPAFLQTGSQGLQEKLQRTCPTSGLLPVCGQPFPGTNTAVIITPANQWIYILFSLKSVCLVIERYSYLFGRWWFLIYCVYKTVN